MKTIMVDLDGTLFDTRMVNYMAYKEAFKSYGYNINYEYYCQFCNGRHYLDFLPALTTDNLETIEDIHVKKLELYSSYLELARINSSLVEILEQCKSTYKIALVTTASRKNTEEILHKFGVFELFDAIISQEDVIRKKPDPECYFIAMDLFHCKPEECIIFEDSESGISAAEKTKATVFVVKGFN